MSVRPEIALEVIKIARSPQQGMAPRTAEAVIEEADAYLKWIDEHTVDTPTKTTQTTGGGTVHQMPTKPKKKKKSYYIPTGRPPGRPKKNAQPAQGQPAQQEKKAA